MGRSVNNPLAQVLGDTQLGAEKQPGIGEGAEPYMYYRAALEASTQEKDKPKT